MLGLSGSAVVKENLWTASPDLHPGELISNHTTAAVAFKYSQLLTIFSKEESVGDGSEMLTT